MESGSDKIVQGYKLHLLKLDCFWSCVLPWCHWQVECQYMSNTCGYMIGREVGR